jgi:hypothetical protein
MEVSNRPCIIVVDERFESNLDALASHVGWIHSKLSKATMPWKRIDATRGDFNELTLYP